MTEKTLLLVEDSPDDAELTLRAFRKNNFYNRIHVARDGAEAIEFLFGSGDGANVAAELPAVVLLDLKLPKIDGLEVLRQIRAQPHTRFLPVVVLTSSNEEVDLISSYRLGANSYVRKPVDFGDFLRATQQLGLYWLVLNETPSARR
jgi:two-component system response regulator